MGDVAAPTAEGPLEGFRVVEISMYMQGPTAGLTLASLGADVIKIEQVGRKDYVRSSTSLFGVPLDDRGRGWLYASLNRGKRSLALDPTTPGGREVFHDLIRSADAFVTNLRPAGLGALGADPETLLAVNPRLVYGRGGGFALEGALADDPCQDTVGMAYGGFMDLLSTTEEPNYPPGAISDILTGTNLASAIVAGLLRRSRTGTGEVVGTTQVQSLLWLQLLPVGMAATIGARMPRFDRATTPNPLFGVYPTSDGWVAIAAIHPAQWEPLARTIGMEHLLTDERFATFDGCCEHRVEMVPLLEACFAQDTTHNWWERLRAGGVWTAPVHRVTDLGDDPHIRASEYLVTFPDGTVGPPAPFDVGSWRGTRANAADYSEHTDEVLAALGYDEDARTTLRIDAAIW